MTDIAVRLDLMTEEVAVVGPRLRYPVPAKRYPSVNDFAEPFDLRWEPVRHVDYDLRHLILGEKCVAVYVPEKFVDGLGVLLGVLNEWADWRERATEDFIYGTLLRLLPGDVVLALKRQVRANRAELDRYVGKVAP